MSRRWFLQELRPTTPKRPRLLEPFSAAVFIVFSILSRGIEDSDNAPSGVTSSIQGWVRSLGRAMLLDRSHNGVRIRAGQQVPAYLCSLRPLGLLAEGDARHLEVVRFLLYASRIGEDRRGRAFQLQHVQIADRLDHVHVGTRRHAEFRESLARAWVQRE